MQWVSVKLCLDSGLAPNLQVGQNQSDDSQKLGVPFPGQAQGLGEGAPEGNSLIKDPHPHPPHVCLFSSLRMVSS